MNSENQTTPKATNQLKKRNIPCLYSALGYIVLETDGTDWYIHQVKGK